MFTCLLSLCVHVSFWMLVHDSWIHVCAFECDCMRISLQLWIWWPGFDQIEMCHIVPISLHNLVWTKVKYQPWRDSDLEHYIISVYITKCMYNMLHTLPKPPSSIDQAAHIRTYIDTQATQLETYLYTVRLHWFRALFEHLLIIIDEHQSARGRQSHNDHEFIFNFTSNY